VTAVVTTTKSVPWLQRHSLLIGDESRPDLHSAGDARGQARTLHASEHELIRGKNERKRTPIGSGR
jgi:hypothetical protein